jgi:hypothetical protein
MNVTEVCQITSRHNSKNWTLSIVSLLGVVPTLRRPRAPVARGSTARWSNQKRTCSNGFSANCKTRPVEQNQPSNALHFSDQSVSANASVTTSQQQQRYAAETNFFVLLCAVTSRAAQAWLSDSEAVYTVMRLLVFNAGKWFCNYNNA